jgi:hypothetical protein
MIGSVRTRDLTSHLPLLKCRGKTSDSERRRPLSSRLAGVSSRVDHEPGAPDTPRDQHSPWHHSREQARPAGVARRPRYRGQTCPFNRAAPDCRNCRQGRHKVAANHSFSRV